MASENLDWKEEYKHLVCQTKLEDIINLNR